MRAFTGWRFVLAIAMPLTLASLGAVNLSYDLLNRVANASNDAEHTRNRKVLEEALNEANASLARLALQNGMKLQLKPKTRLIPSGSPIPGARLMEPAKALTWWPCWMPTAMLSQEKPRAGC
jgi:hypothetical protein